MGKERGFKWSNGRRKKENGEGRRRRAAALFFRNNLLELTQYDRKARDLIPELLGCAMAAWSVLNSGALSKEVNSNDVLLRPHNLQVLATLCMLGTHDESRLRYLIETFWKYVPGASVNPTGHLCELLTGEGKSVVLAGAAVVLALLGNNVSVACYSKYLSERDAADFQSLFECFEVDQYITYGSISAAIESQLAARGDFRKGVVELVRTGDGKTAKRAALGEGGDASKVTKRPNVLLFDEADICISEKIFGGTFNLGSTALAKAETAALLRRIYEEQPPSADVAEAWPEFKALKGKLAPGDGHKVALSALQNMIVDLKRVGTREIVINNGKIGYVEHDGVSYTTYYGYTTMFEYIKAEKEKNLTAANADAQIGLDLRCGSIAYADMPETYAAVLGVTGTLAALDEEEMKLLRTEYKISKTIAHSFHLWR